MRGEGKWLPVGSGGATGRPAESELLQLRLEFGSQVRGHAKHLLEQFALGVGALGLREARTKALHLLAAMTPATQFTLTFDHGKLTPLGRCGAVVPDAERPECEARLRWRQPPAEPA